MFIGIVDLHIPYTRKLFEHLVQGARNVIRCSIRLAITGQIEAQDVPITFESAISDKTILNRDQTFCLFGWAWTLEVLIQSTFNRIPSRRNRASN